jgi:hypothetical protein
VGTAFISRGKVVACSTRKMKALRSFETSVAGVTDRQYRLDSLKFRATHPMGRGLNTGRLEHEAQSSVQAAAHTNTHTHTHTYTHTHNLFRGNPSCHVLCEVRAGAEDVIEQRV